MNKSKIILFARELRKKQTPEEKLLWEELRNRRLNGLKFLRQHPIIYENDPTKDYYFLLLIFIVLKSDWLSSWMERFMIFRKNMMQIEILF